MLTPRQFQLLDFIKAEIMRCGSAPTYDEMAAALGVASKSAISELVNGLVERGFICKLPNRRRSIQIVEHGPLWHIAEAKRQIEASPLAGKVVILEHLAAAEAHLENEEPRK